MTITRTASSNDYHRTSARHPAPTVRSGSTYAEILGVTAATVRGRTTRAHQGPLTQMRGWA